MSDEHDVEPEPFDPRRLFERAAREKVERRAALHEALGRAEEPESADVPDELVDAIAERVISRLLQAGVVSEPPDFFGSLAAAQTERRAVFERALRSEIRAASRGG
jgi:hypothetical protein